MRGHHRIDREIRPARFISVDVAKAKNILASLIPKRAIQFPGNREAAAIHLDAAAGFDQRRQGKGDLPWGERNLPAHLGGHGADCGRSPFQPGVQGCF